MSVDISQGKRQLETTRHRYEDNIKMDLQEAWCKDVNWIQLAPMIRIM